MSSMPSASWLTMATTNIQVQPEDHMTSMSVDNRIITNPSGEKESVVKFLFQPKTSNNNTAIALTHYAILKTITIQRYKHLIIMAIHSKNS